MATCARDALHTWHPGEKRKAVPPKSSNGVGEGLEDKTSRQKCVRNHPEHPKMYHTLLEAPHEASSTLPELETSIPRPSWLPCTSPSWAPPTSQARADAGSQ